MGSLLTRPLGFSERSKTLARKLDLVDDPEAWLAMVSPSLTRGGDRHARFWNHVAAIQPGLRPRPYIAPWPRKGGKSTSAEGAVAYVAERERRRYCLYVCGSQVMADQHVGSIETIFGRIGGPLARPAVNTQGFQRGWKKSQKITESGFVLQGIGLDSVMRGAKLDDVVPDIIVLDDIDERHDSAATTQKKIEIITETILPAGTAYCAVFGLQNLIIANGVFAQLCDGQADFLADRIVDGPFKAIEGLVTEDVWDEVLERMIKRIVGGEPTWQGQDIEACQNYIISYGFRAFDREMQQNVKDVEGALWSTDLINSTRITPDAIPALTRVAVGVDPATSSKGTSNETGIIGSGRTANKHGYVLEDQSGILSPAQWGRRAVVLLDGLMHEHESPGVIVAEKNQGGEMVELVIRNAAEKLHREGERKTPHVQVKLVHASRGKRARAEPVAQMYDEAAVHHVGEFSGLEDQMTTWNAADGDESPDRVDALVWGMTELGIVKTPPRRPARRTGTRVQGGMNV